MPQVQQRLAPTEEAFYVILKAIFSSPQAISLIQSMVAKGNGAMQKRIKK
jgi:hypothetical protein